MNTAWDARQRAPLCYTFSRVRAVVRQRRARQHPV